MAACISGGRGRQEPWRSIKPGNKYFVINLMYNLCGQKRVSSLSKTDKRQQRAPAVHPSPSTEKYHSCNGLTFVSTCSTFYNIAPTVDKGARHPANRELMCCLGEPKRTALLSAVTQPTAF